jgi:hypothetical protein
MIFVFVAVLIAECVMGCDEITGSACVEVCPQLFNGTGAGSFPFAVFSLPKNFTRSCPWRAITPGSG